MTARPPTLRRQLALWTCAASLLGLFVFAIAAYVIVSLEEQEEADEGVPDDPADVATEAREEMLIAFAIAAPIGLALSFGAASWSSRRVMARFQRVAREAAEISVDRFDRRMEVPPPGDELRPLAEAINDLVARLQRGYDALAAFSADASHELRTPLAAVCSELEVNLRRPRSREDWESSARTALSELRRLSGVVDAMLRFAQADASRVTDAGDVELAALIGDVLARHGKAAAGGGVALEAGALEADVVRGDPELLATALSNLVGNAVRVATPGGHVWISARAGADAVEVVVEDTGPGLRGDRATLFEPFSKLGDDDHGGVGLGLAIARRIAVRHGGDLTYADRIPAGARFTIRLPRA